MTLIETFQEWLESTLGQDVHISKAPENPSYTWWVRSAGGSQTAVNVNGAKTIDKVIEVYYRDANSKNVAEKLESLADDISCTDCLILNGYNVIETLVSGPYTDQDKDEQGRTVGLLQITIIIYKEII